MVRWEQKAGLFYLQEVCPDKSNTTPPPSSLVYYATRGELGEGTVTDYADMADTVIVSLTTLRYLLNVKYLIHPLCNTETSRMLVGSVPDP
jgi:hypothetical protein